MKIRGGDEKPTMKTKNKERKTKKQKCQIKNENKKRKREKGKRKTNKNAKLSISARILYLLGLIEQKGDSKFQRSYRTIGDHKGPYMTTQDHTGQ